MYDFAELTCPSLYRLLINVAMPSQLQCSSSEFWSLPFASLRLRSKDTTSSTEGERTPSKEPHSHYWRTKPQSYHHQKKHQSWYYRSSSSLSTTSQSSTNNDSYSSNSTSRPEPKWRHQQVSSDSSSSVHSQCKHWRTSKSSRDTSHKH